MGDQGLIKRKEWNVEDLALIHFDEALQLQEQCWESVKSGSDHFLLLLEHHPVLTFGRRSKANHILIAESEIEKLGVEIQRADRGGSVTYHGPGQLVGYIICKSSRYGGIHQVVTLIMKTIIQALTHIGIKTRSSAENPGIWTNDLKTKIGAIGMSNRQGITMHGFSINVNNDLTIYSKFVPCGLTAPVSSISEIMKAKVTMDDVKESVLKYFLKNFN